MAQQNNAQTIALQLEKVRDKVPLLYERDDVLLSMIQQRGDVEKVSSRNMRLPLQLVPGGKAGSYSADGGDLGLGSGTTYDVAQVSPIFFRFAVQITKLVEYASNSREKAIENAVKREVANGMKQFRAFLDKVIQTAGNGVLGTISSIASNTFTMAVPTGAALVYVGQTIQIYDPTLTTNRNVAASVVSSVTAADPISSTQTITVDNVPSGTSVNDVIVHDGLTGASPVSLFGIKYHQNNATTGTWLNLNRATYPQQLQTPRVNAGERRSGSRPRAPGDQQGPQGAGHQPSRKTHRLHQRRAGTRLGKSGHHGFADRQGRAGRPRERPRHALLRKENDVRHSDQIFGERRSDARGFPRSVALGPRGDEGHRLLRGGRADRVPDLRRERRHLRVVHLLLRHRISGVE